MAKNQKHGYRKGAVKKRSQFYNPDTGLWSKRGEHGEIIDTKTTGGKFKGVRKEKQD